MGNPSSRTFRWVGILVPAIYYSLGRYGYPAVVSLLILSGLILVPAALRRFPPGGGNRNGGTGLGPASLLPLLVSSLLTILLFDRSLAIAALVFLAIHRSAANAVGGRSMPTGIHARRWVETAVGLGAAGISGALLSVLPGLEISWWTVLAGVTATTLMDCLPIPVEADFRVPLFSASVMHLVHLFAGRSIV